MNFSEEYIRSGVWCIQVAILFADFSEKWVAIAGRLLKSKSKKLALVFQAIVTLSTFNFEILLAVSLPNTTITHAITYTNSGMQV